MDLASYAAPVSIESDQSLDRLIECADVFEESVVIEGVVIRTAGLCTQYGGELVVGSAASVDESPLPRARTELAERLAIVSAMGRHAARWPVRDRKGPVLDVVATSDVFAVSPESASCRWARSNGVAAADDWSVAADRAHFEALERDRVLRSWYGEVVPQRIDPPSWFSGALGRIYDIEAYSFGAASTGDSFTTGVFGFPKRDANPFVHGFACGPTLAGALLSSARECLQRLGFLWGEPLPSSPVLLSPTPDFHQDYYLVPGNQARLRRWLRGEHAAFEGLLNVQERSGPARFVDLTPNWRGRGWRVAKAVVPGLVPLAFGVGHPLVLGALPPECQVHPIA